MSTNEKEERWDFARRLRPMALIDFCAEDEKSSQSMAPPMMSYIWEATLSATGAITVWTEPMPWPADDAHGAQANAGCKA